MTRSRMRSDGEGVVLGHVGRSAKDQTELDRQAKMWVRETNCGSMEWGDGDQEQGRGKWSNQVD
jgi:hypothetical protein